MRAGVTQAHHGGAVGQHLVHHAEIATGVVLERVQQHAPALVGQQRVQRQRPGAAGLALSAGQQALRRVGLVVQRRAEGERAAEGLVEPGGQRVAGALADQALAQRRIVAQALVASPRCQRCQRQPGRVVLEGVAAGLEAEQHADALGTDLAGHVQPGAARGMDLVERLAPQPGRVVDLQQQQRQRPAGGFGRGAQDLEITVAEVGVDLQHALARPPQCAGDGEQLGLGCRQAGGVAAVARTVLDGARGGDAQRAGPQRVLSQLAHQVELGAAGALLVVGATITHGIEAQRRMGQLRADVHRVVAAFQRIQVLRKRLPGPIYAFGQHRAGDVLDALHQVDQVIGAARAHRREADAAIAEHGGCDPVPARGREKGIPGGLAVVMGVDVDEAGRDQQAAGIDHPLRVAQLVADGDDEPALHRHISRVGRRAGAVDDSAALDEDVVHGGLRYWVCGPFWQPGLAPDGTYAPAQRLVVAQASCMKLTAFSRQPGGARA